MGINVELQTEDGRAIDGVLDPQSLLPRALPEVNDPEFHYANTIDWYGDTVFNRFQSELLRKEWAILIEKAGDEGTAKLLRRIDGMLLDCASGIHMYVKFIGD